MFDFTIMVPYLKTSKRNTGPLILMINDKFYPSLLLMQPNEERKQVGFRGGDQTEEREREWEKEWDREVDTVN